MDIQEEWIVTGSKEVIRMNARTTKPKENTTFKKKLGTRKRENQGLQDGDLKKKDECRVRIGKCRQP